MSSTWHPATHPAESGSGTASSAAQAPTAADADRDVRRSSVLRLVADDLARLVAASEDGFTAFGVRLERALLCLTRLSAGAGAALAAVDEGSLGARLAQVRVCVDETPALLRASDDRLDALLERVAATLALLDELRTHNRAFLRLVRTLRALAVSARVESVRLGDGGVDFEQLSQAVRRLAGDITERSSGVAARAQRLAGEVQTSGETLSNVRSGLDAELGGSLGALREALYAMARQGATSRELGAVLQADVAALGRDVGSAVEATQYQDITRQRLEHAGDTLRATHAALGDGETLRRRVATVAKLQCEQLRAAEKDFSTAMLDVTTAAADAVTRARVVGQTVERLGGDGAGRASLARIRDALDRLTRGVRRSAEAGEDVSLGIAETIALASEIAGQVEGIDAIGEDLRLIALNAITQASDTGTAGRALAVIAREISEQSSHARTLTRDLSAHLRRVGEEASSLDQGAEAFARGAREGADELVGRLAPFVESLSQVDDDFRRGVDEVSGVLGELTAAIAALDDGLGFHRRFGDEVRRAVERLDDVARDAPGRAAWCPDDEAWLESLGLSTRYTMHSQRSVHAAVVFGAPQAGTAGTANAAAGPDFGGDGLGDNVELF